MSQVTAVTTGGPGSTRICHIPCFNTSPKDTNAIRMREAEVIFLRDLMQAEVDGKRGQEDKWKSGEMGNIIIGTTRSGSGTASVVHRLALCQHWEALQIMPDMEQ